MSDIPGLYIPAHELIVGDLIVHQNRILQIGRFKRPSRFATDSDGPQTAIVELWLPGKVHGEPLHELTFPCIDSQVRLHSARR